MNLLKMLCETYPQIAIGPSINYAAVSDNFDIFEYLLMSMENVDLTFVDQTVESVYYDAQLCSLNQTLFIIYLIYFQI